LIKDVDHDEEDQEVGGGLLAEAAEAHEEEWHYHVRVRQGEPRAREVMTGARGAAYMVSVLDDGSIVATTDSFPDTKVVRGEAFCRLDVCGAHRSSRPVRSGAGPTTVAPPPARTVVEPVVQPAVRHVQA
jgi:hypothetical protein